MRLAQRLHLRQRQRAPGEGAFGRQPALEHAGHLQERQRQSPAHAQAGRAQPLFGHQAGHAGGGAQQPAGHRAALQQPLHQAGALAFGGTAALDAVPHRAHLLVLRIGAEPLRDRLDEGAPVDDAVVHLAVQRDAAVGQAVDDPELPQQSRAVEQRLVQRAHLLQQLRHRRLVERQPVHVALQVGIGHRLDRRSLEQRHLQPVVEGRPGRALQQLAAQLVGKGSGPGLRGRAQQHQRADVERALGRFEHEHRQVHRRQRGHRLLLRRGCGGLQCPGLPPSEGSASPRKNFIARRCTKLP